MIISQETGTTVFEKLQQLQSTGSSNSKNYGLDKKKGSSDRVTVNQSLVCCICSTIANKLYSTLLAHISHGRQLFLLPGTVAKGCGPFSFRRYERLSSIFGLYNATFSNHIPHNIICEVI
jgi:hypothetical protein